MAVNINGDTGIDKIQTGAVESSDLADNSIGADKLNVTGNGNAGQALTSDADGSFSWTDMGGGGGSLKSQRFNSPGTWTKPASTNSVKVTVIGGGAGGTNPNSNATGSPGGTSTFGGLVTATGAPGVSRNYPGQPPGGTASYTAGDPIMVAPGMPGTYSAQGQVEEQRWNFGGVHGWLSSPNNTSYNLRPSSATNGYLAGHGGSSGQSYANGGSGGKAIVGNVPVTGPVSVTVGAGATRVPGPSACAAGIGGTVIVEWIEE